MFSGTLIRSGNNAKTVKGDKISRFETAIMYLAPHTLAAQILGEGSATKLSTVCPLALTAKCAAPCLNTAGRGRFTNAQVARARKTERYWRDRAAFMAALVADLEAFERYCSRKGLKPACRLNGTSDIQFEVNHPCVRKGRVYASVFAAFPRVRFYDSTKITKRVRRGLPRNYDLTLSYSMANVDYADSVLTAAAETGANVAVVFRSKALRDQFASRSETFIGVKAGGASILRRVIDGDRTDMRFSDPR